jgi:hypothetical protein
MADEYDSGIRSGGIPPVPQTPKVGQRTTNVAPTPKADDHKRSPHEDALPQIDGFSLENVTPDAARILLGHPLMEVADANSGQSRLDLLKATLEKIRDGMPLNADDDNTLVLAGAMVNSAPLMLAASLPHGARENKITSLRPLAEDFARTARELGVYEPHHSLSI